ncbi:E3 ubiquitin-protein ligase SPL2 [Bienertia sinuspersici]
MSAGDQAVAAITAQMALAGDGALLGLALAYVAFRSLTKFAATSSARRKILDAPSVHVSDLRSLIKDETDGGDGNEGERISKVLVVVRGSVEPKSVVNGSWKSLWPDVIVSNNSGDRGVVIQRSQKGKQDTTPTKQMNQVKEGIKGTNMGIVVALQDVLFRGCKLEQHLNIDEDIK